MRPTTPAEMATIHDAAFRDSRPWSASEIETLLRQPTIHAVTAPHGVALIQIIPPEAELLTIAVAPQAQGKGHGRALLGRTLAHARDLGADTVFLEVDAENEPALALYAAAGFTRTGARKGYYRHRDGHRSDAVMLSCALNSSPDKSA